MRDKYSTFGIRAGSDFGTTEVTANFHVAALKALEKVHGLIASAKSIDPDLIPSKRLERQARMIQPAKRAIAAEIEKAARCLQAPIATLYGEAAKASRGKTPDDPMAALLHHLEVTELRRQIEALPEGDRVRHLYALADAGDHRLMPALDGALLPLTGQGIVDSLRDRYVRASAAPLMDRIEIAEAEAEEAVAIVRQVGSALDRFITSEGLGEALGVNLGRPEAVQAMSDAEKSRFIAEHGAEAFKVLCQTGQKPEVEG